MSGLVKYDNSYYMRSEDTGEFTEVPRVTSVLSPGGIPDHIAPYLLRGTRVHEWTEAEDAGALTRSDRARIQGLEVEKYLEAWQAFKERYKWYSHMIEWSVVGTLDGFTYAGTADRYGKFPLAFDAVLDIKTTNAAKPGRSSQHGMQLAAYAHAIEQTLCRGMPDQGHLKAPKNLDRGVIVYLRGDGTYVLHHYDLDEFLPQFTEKLRKYYGEYW